MCKLDCHAQHSNHFEEGFGTVRRPDKGNWKTKKGVTVMKCPGNPDRNNEICRLCIRAKVLNVLEQIVREVAAREATGVQKGEFAVMLSGAALGDPEPTEMDGELELSPPVRRMTRLNSEWN